MGSAFHQLCPRYSGTLTPTAPTAIRLWDTFTFTFFTIRSYSQLMTNLSTRRYLEYMHMLFTVKFYKNKITKNDPIFI